MKMNSISAPAALALLGVFAILGSTAHGQAPAKKKRPAPIKTLVCVLAPTEGNSAHGTVTFTRAQGKVKVHAVVEGLEPNSTHAIHVHQFGDITGSDGKKTGGHYNPGGHEHALPEKDERHGGDLGNLKADADGKADYKITVSNITLTGRMNGVLGRGVIVHAKADDGGQPTGNAGSRIAQGVIGVANSGK